MDVYHKVLMKLYQVTGGRDSVTVDIKDLVKQLGFLGNYNDILQKLCGQGWVVETSKINFVKITHWGVKEAKDSGTSQPDAAQSAQKSTAKLISESKLVLIMFEEFSTDMTKEKLTQIEKKLNDINSAISVLKSSIT